MATFHEGKRGAGRHNTSDIVSDPRFTVSKEAIIPFRLTDERLA
jgi:hypothetical protein